MSGFTTNLRADTPAVVDSGKEAIVASGLEALDGAITRVQVITSAGGVRALNDEECKSAVFHATGALTSNLIVEFPLRTRVVWFVNDSTGAFTVQVRSGLGTPQTIAAGARKQLWIKDASGGLEVLP